MAAYIPFAERAGFEDVVPVQQDDGPNAPVQIAYPAAFVDAMNYFRALCATNERSERALEVTSAVIVSLSSMLRSLPPTVSDHWRCLSRTGVQCGQLHCVARAPTLPFRRANKGAAS